MTGGKAGTVSLSLSSASLGLVVTGLPGKQSKEFSCLKKSDGNESPPELKSKGFQFRKRRPDWDGL